MEHKLACLITNWCRKRYEMTDDQAVTATYGIELFLNNVLKMAALFVIAIITGRILEYFISIGCFALLRYYAGGLHMETSLGCFMTMLIIFVLSCLGAEFVHSLPVFVIPLCAVVSIVILGIYAPFFTKNNPIREPLLIKRKKWGAVLLAACFFAAAMLIPVWRFKMLIVIPATIESLSILPLWHIMEKNKK